MPRSGCSSPTSPASSSMPSKRDGWRYRRGGMPPLKLRQADGDEREAAPVPGPGEIGFRRLRLLRKQATLPECHALHYLQMTTEMVGKAHASGSGLKKLTHRAIVPFCAACPATARPSNSSAIRVGMRPGRRGSAPVSPWLRASRTRRGARPGRTESRVSLAPSQPADSTRRTDDSKSGRN